MTRFDLVTATGELWRDLIAMEMEHYGQSGYFVRDEEIAALREMCEIAAKHGDERQKGIAKGFLEITKEAKR